MPAARCSSAFSAGSFPPPAISSTSDSRTTSAIAFTARCGVLESRLNELRQNFNI